MGPLALPPPPLLRAPAPVAVAVGAPVPAPVAGGALALAAVEGVGAEGVDVVGTVVALAVEGDVSELPPEGGDK